MDCLLRAFGRCWEQYAIHNYISFRAPFHITHDTHLCIENTWIIVLLLLFICSSAHSVLPVFQRLAQLLLWAAHCSSDQRRNRGQFVIVDYKRSVAHCKQCGRELQWKRAKGLGAELCDLPHAQWKQTQERIRWKYSSVDERMDELPYLVSRSWSHSDVHSIAFPAWGSDIWYTIRAAVSNCWYPNGQILGCHMWVVAASLDNRYWDWTGKLPPELKA